MKGKFIPFLLPFKEGEKFISNEEQALRILTKANSLIIEGYSHVYITYSANYDQTRSITAAYNSNKWQTHTGGANQAAVMSAMEDLLAAEFKHLQGKMRIAPVSTLTYSDFGGHTHKEVIEKDLQQIEEHLQHGEVVLGWMNQNTQPRYAIGGGIAQLPEALNELIQTKLKELAKSYA